ncbi:hypothetical protein N7485_002900 [Penicillium canescens]|nr:hypothetical protein N7485_002900 [Penicillium canescens]
MSALSKDVIPHPSSIPITARRRHKTQIHGNAPATQPHSQGPSPRSQSPSQARGADADAETNQHQD